MILSAWPIILSVRSCYTCIYIYIYRTPCIYIQDTLYIYIYRVIQNKRAKLKQDIDIEIYSRAHSPTFPSLHLRHSSFSNPSPALPTSQLILQPFRRFTYVTVHSQTLPLLHLRHSSFSNPCFASTTSPGEPAMM